MCYLSHDHFDKLGLHLGFQQFTETKLELSPRCAHVPNSTGSVCHNGGLPMREARRARAHPWRYGEVSSPPRVEGGAVRRERREERWFGVAKRSSRVLLHRRGEVVAVGLASSSGDAVFASLA